MAKKLNSIPYSAMRDAIPRHKIGEGIGCEISFREWGK
jgi:hypothetical protein